MIRPHRSLRLVGRDFRRRPGFNLAVITTLALSLGACIAIFSFVHLLRYKQLNARRPSHLVGVWTGDENPELDGFGWVSFPDFEHYRDHSAPVLSAAAAWMVNLVSLASDDGGSRWAQCWSVSGNYFQLLGVDAELGRALVVADDLPGAARVAVLSHTLWQGRFGGDQAVIGKTVRLNAHAFVIVGVAPRGFTGTWAARHADLWVTHRNTDVLRSSEVDWLHDPGVRWLGVIARLKSGVSIEQAEQALRLEGRWLQELYPDARRSRRTRVVAASPVMPVEKAQYLPAAGALTWAAWALLAVACTNIAILFLVRVLARQRELATRLAIGASRRQLLVELLVHGAVLSVLGCILGLAVGALGCKMIAYFVSAWGKDLTYDWSIALLTLGIAAGLPLLLAILQILAIAKVNLGASLRESPMSGSKWGSWRHLGDALVVAEIALALVLALGAGLLQRSVGELRQIDLGFSPRGVLMAQVNVTQGNYSPAEGRLFFSRLLAELATVGGVEGASLVRIAPLHGMTRDVEVTRPEAPEHRLSIHFNVIAPGYFRLLEIPMLAGREIEPGDDATAPKVLVVNQALADQLWPGQRAVGRSLLLEDPTRPEPVAPFEVVGVAADSLYEAIDTARPRPQIYLSFHQNYHSTLNLLLRSAAPSKEAEQAVREILAKLDPNLALGEVTTLFEFVAGSIWEQRMVGEVALSFAVLAVLVALLGVFSILSHAVRRRTHELGVRLVVGAQRADLLKLVLNQGLRLLLFGLLLGLPLAFWGLRRLAHLLFAISWFDPLTLLAVFLSFTTVALLAAYLPARRAAALRPQESIRWEH